MIVIELKRFYLQQFPMEKGPNEMFVCAINIFECYLILLPFCQSKMKQVFRTVNAY